MFKHSFLDHMKSIPTGSSSLKAILTKQSIKNCIVSNFSFILAFELLAGVYRMKIRVLKWQRLLDDFFIVDSANLQFAKFDGSWSPVVRRLNLNRGEAVAVLIYLQDRNSFVLIRQFRFAAFEVGEPGWIDEIVAGVVDDESPETCARRECLEEAGYELERLGKIATIYTSPGITTERVHPFPDLTSSAKKRDMAVGWNRKMKTFKSSNGAGNRPWINCATMKSRTVKPYWRCNIFPWNITWEIPLKS